MKKRVPARPATCRSARYAFLLVLGGLLLVPFLAASSAPSDRSISSISFSPDNTFDNQVVTAGSDSGTWIQLNLSGGAAAANNPDNEGGYRIEIYNASGNLVRRLASEEIDTAPTTKVRFNGQGDSNVNDTLPYGSYTVRAYSSLRDLSFPAEISGAGITVDRPGDVHVSSGGVVSWMNTGTRLSFCQVSLGDPNTQEPTFLRLVDLPSGFGFSNADYAWGIAMNSKNEVFLSDNYNGGAAGTRIAKYSTASETWIAYNWATAATTTAADDEWYGLAVDSRDSVYVALATTVAGGGNGGAFEGVVRFRDNGTTATAVNQTPDHGDDMMDVGVIGAGDTYIYTINRRRNEIIRYTTALALSADPLISPAGGTPEGGLDVSANGNIYATDNTVTPSLFRKISPTGTVIYTVTDAQINNASGIAVWYRAATGETFVIVGGRASNALVIYKENAAGDSATYLRQFQDDVSNLAAPEGLAVDPDSAVFVVNRSSRAVKKFSTDGVFQNLSGATNGRYIQGIDVTADLSDPAGFNVPRAVAVDSFGSIYVFDHNNATAPSQVALKKFSSNGTALGVVMDVDNQGWSAAFSQPVIQATAGSNGIYAVTNLNIARLLWIGTDGTLLGHLGSGTAGGGADAAEGNTTGDITNVQIAPFFDRTNNRFFPEALYIHQRAGGGADRIDVFRPDLSGGAIVAGITPQENTGTNPSANNPSTMLVTEAGEYIFMNDATSGGNYLFRVLNAASPAAALAANALAEFTIPRGNGSGQLNTPREAVWTDNRGVFKLNPITGRYERKLWVNDSANNRMVQILMAWNDVQEASATIALSQDTPLVVSIAVSGETVTSIGGTYYVGATTCTVQVNFSKAMVTAGSPDTMTVQFKPQGGSFTSLTRRSYSGSTWTGTAAITAGMADGEVIVKVADAYDSDGTVRFIAPNPSQTDFDVADDFKPFVIDKTAPVFSVSLPASGGDSTSEATYTVSGQVTSEATGLDATIQIINWTAASGGTQVDSKSLTASASDGSFSGVLTLKSPSPSDNYIEVVAVDKLGNRSTLSPRRLVQRQKNLGNAYIEPSTETTVGAPRRYRIVYTAAQTLSGDTIRVTVPTNWSAPQKSNGSVNGYVTVTETTTYTDSTFSGQAVTLRGVTLGIGQTLTINYGDSVLAQSGMAKADLDASLADASNRFSVDLQQVGETSFTSVTAQSGKTLTVALRDSGLGVATIETGPGGGSILVAKGGETRVLTLRLFNSNVGNHVNRVTQLVLTVESDTGGAVPWNGVASRIIAKNTAEGVTFSDITSIPATPTVSLTPSNLVVEQGLSRDVEIHVTISGSATVDTARFHVSGLASVTAVDSVSGKTLTVVEQAGGIVGRKTGLYDIIGLLPADTLYVGADTSFTPSDVATGQVDAGLMDLVFRNAAPGADTPVNAIRVERVVLSVRDAAGASLIPVRVLKGLYVRSASGATTYGGVDTPSLPTTGDTVSIDLSGLSVGSNQAVTVRVFASIANDTLSFASSLRLRLADTRQITAKDQTSQLAVQVRDDPARAETLPFQTDSVAVQGVARGTLASMTLLRSDSTRINGKLGQQLLTGEQFFVALRYSATAGRSGLRVIPSETDLVLRIAGVNRTSEFTIAAPAAKTVAAGSEDTFTYGVVQNLGSTTGTLRVEVSDTTSADTRPRLFDQHDYTAPDQLRARLVLPPPSETVAVTSSPLTASVFTLDTTYANCQETAVPAVRFQVVNNRVATRYLDSVVVEALSAGAAVTQVRLYHDNRNGVLNPATDTLVATGTLSAGETVHLVLSPKVTMAASGGTETFFVAFDFASAQTDGDTVDARIPANGLLVHLESPFPTSSLNSTGDVRVEVVATRLVISPDTQIVATGAAPTFTLSAVDACGNLDNIINYETLVQGRNAQVSVTLTDSTPYLGDTTYSLTATSGLTGVTPTPGSGVTSVNGYLSGGQGVVTVTATRAETVAIALSSVLLDSTVTVQFANLLSASAVSLASSDSGRPDSRGLAVLAFRVTNQGGSRDTLTRVGVRSLNTQDTDISRAILFRDVNGNGDIDSGTDAYLADAAFANGFATFTGLASGLNTGESALYLVGYNLATTLVDWDLLDARADTVDMATGGNLAGSGLNSSPNRRVDIKALHIDLTPASSSTGTGSDVTVTASAKDAYHNTDRDYTGSTGLTFDLTGSAQFSASSTLANEVLPVSGDYTQIRGNLVQGTADLVFSDNTAETSILSVTASPGLTGTNDTGVYVFSQGIVVTALSLSSATVSRGDTNRVLLSFRVSASGTSDSVTRIRVHYAGTNRADVTNVRMYRDVDANEIFSVTTDTLYGSATSFTTDTVTFQDTVYIANGNSRAFFCVLDVDAAATSGDTIDLELLQGSITTKTGLADVPSGIRNSTGSETVYVEPVVGGALSSDSLAVASDTVTSGAADVEVLRFFVRNPKASTDSIQAIVVRNDGTHTDTGITVRVVIDANKDGVYAAGTDYGFGSAGSFTGGILTRTDSASIASGDSVHFLVLFTMSPTLTIDSRTLRARVDSGGLTTFAGLSACTQTLRSNGTVRTYIAPATSPAELDSVTIRGGSAVSNGLDTAVISISVVDTNGNPANGRTVWLRGDTGSPITVTTANPQTTDATGLLLFAVRSTAAGNYNFQCSVNGVNASAVTVVTFLSPNAASGGVLGGNPASNTQRAVQSGSASQPYFIGNVAFGGAANPNTMVYVRADGTNWQLVKQDVGAGATTLLTKPYSADNETGQVNYLASVDVENTSTTMGSGEHAIVGIISRARGRRSQIYAVNLSTGDSVRISPNNPASVTNANFTTLAWRWFDMNPNGETVVMSQDGNLVVFSRGGATWDNYVDSGRMRYLTAWTKGYGIGAAPSANNATYAAYPQWSPDGTRLAFVLVYVSDLLPNGPAVQRSELYVLKNYSSTLLGGYPTLSPYPSIVDTAHASLVKIAVSDSFPFYPRWTPNGDGLVFSSASGSGWDWQKVFGYPQDSGVYDTAAIVTRFVYYDKGTESAPYDAVDITSEPQGSSSAGGLDVVMQRTGTQRFAYVRKTTGGGNRTFELRTVDLSSEATITSQGGVIMDSGRVVVVVPPNESYGSGLRIASRTPDSTPAGQDSVITTGAAKSFYSPSNPAAPVYFPDTITILMYYSASHFTETELVGFDSDGDGIPDRTEAAVSAYYWNGTSWVDYGAVRYPSENKIEFKTTHFSTYAVGVPMEARALAFGGTVNDVIAYPNPWRADRSPTAAVGVGDERFGIKLTRMPGPDVRVRVFTITGELVAEGTVNTLNSTSTNPSVLRVTQAITNDATVTGTISWPLVNQSGRAVASGVYLILLDGPGGRAVRKVAVIR